jgi:hypothetical protein
VTQTYSPARRFERHAVELSVVCGDDAHRLADRVVNLSSGGACVQTPAPLPPGSLHTFFFTVPDARYRDSVVSIPATIAWTGRNAMGLRFESRSGGIDDYLKRLERAFRSF